MPANSLIPDIPGVPLANETQRGFLNEHVGRLCGVSGGRFPGSQPVSFTSASLDLLETMDFWVCEKSDGVRVLLLILFNSGTGNQEVWLIDRKQRYFLVDDIHFTHWERTDDPLTDTIIDGELIIDVDESGEHTLRFYAFDCLVVAGDNIMKKPLVSRYGRLKSWVVDPFQAALTRFPEWRENLPFDVVAKKMELSYSVAQVLNVHIPKLQHGHDGLIFTCAESAYVPATDDKILKWKPPSENSIDFKLELRFPPNPVGEPDFYAKPIFLLYTWMGGKHYELFGEMAVDDEEWEMMKKSREQFDDRIVEVTWDNNRESWRMMRFRDDKPNANHKSIVDKIMESIRDGVEIEEVLSRTDSIRNAWKARQAGGARKGTMAATPGGAVKASVTTGASGAGGYPQTPQQPLATPTQGVMAGLKR